ncbi:MAG: polysaccharide deacetylase family protein [Euryarchaeota archaeon]|nr:polysaccharide deacetylase family protein [Euryarchaeota archaeon]
MNTTDNTGTVATNILTVDVEDWYMDTDISTWGLYEDRVVESTNKIIKLLNESDTKATFFILGYVAEHFPELVERIRDGDHEVATHGYSHTPITQQTPSEFEEDMLKSIGVLEKITGDKIMGYRACNFTVMEETTWAIDVLKRNGLKYDSSVFPVKTHLYGVPDAPLFPYRISPADITKEAGPEEGFLEIPFAKRVRNIQFHRKGAGRDGCAVSDA